MRILGPFFVEVELPRGGVPKTSELEIGDEGRSIAGYCTTQPWTWRSTGAIRSEKSFCAREQELSGSRFQEWYPFVHKEAESCANKSWAGWLELLIHFEIIKL